MNKNRIKKLLEIPGVSGREEIITKEISKNIKKNGFEISYDNLGSVWGVKKSSNLKAKTLFIDAHMDEVGFLVSDITDSGLLKLEPMGGIWNATLNSQRLRVWTNDFKESYSGVVLWPNVNTHQGSNKKTPNIEDMLLDIGASSKKEVLKWGITQSSTVTFDTITEFNGNRVISKATDNRVGVSLSIDVMEHLKNKELDYNVVIGSSVQEETGLVGARTSAYKYKPDLAIVIDVSPANDIPSPQEPKGILGNGTMLRHKDARTIYPKTIVEYLRNLMKKENIKYQDYFSFGGTNAGVIHVSNEGIKTIPVGLVARNLHTGSSVFDLSDYRDTEKLLISIIDDLSSSKINKLSK